MDKYHLCVEIPYEAEIAYTLHTDGILADKPQEIDSGNFYLFKYPLNSVVVLFYNFKFLDKESKIKKTRKAYIVTAQNILPGTKDRVALPGLNMTVTVLFSCKGRTVDYLKHIMNTLRNQDDVFIFKMTYIFWYKMAAIAKYGKGNEFDTIRMYKRYKEVK